MKSRILVLMSTITVFAVLGIQIRVAAQDQQAQKLTHRYSVTVLSELVSGLGAGGNSINNKGWVAGAASLPCQEPCLPGTTIGHATLWRNGVITDLHTLGGPNSNSFVNGPIKNDRGLIVGISETSTPDPLGEEFCAAPFLSGFKTLTCLGFLWQQNGGMTPLPPLGGNNSSAGGANNRGQVVGAAENSTHDPTCIAPQLLQIEAVIWELNQDKIQIPQELPPLDGDLDGAAGAINDKGQVAGCSGTCGNAFGVPGCVHAVVWENGSPTDIGGLGTTCATYAAGPSNCNFNGAAAINNRGQVGGLSLLPDGTTFHSFLWENGVPTDLGVLPGDVTGCVAPCPYVLTWFGGMNNKGQVVGHTCDVSDTYCSAYLWQNGVMTDLNTLISPGSSLFLYYAADINDRGEITGQGIDLNNPGNFPPFLLIPCDEEHADDVGCQATSQVSVRVERPKVVLPENVREQLQRRMLFGRFRGHLGGAR